MKRISTFTLLVVLLSASLLHASPPPGTQADNNWIDTGSYDISWYDGGASSEYTLTTAAQLAGLSALVCGKNTNWPTGSNSETPLRNKVIKLDADIDLSEHYWVPIGQGQNSFGGWFDGQGHTITGLYIDYSDESYAFTDPATSTAANIYQGGANVNTGNMAGLFGRVNNQNAGGYIQNIVLGEGLIKTHPSCFAAGALIGFNNRNVNLTVSNIINMGVEVIGGAQVGGIVGYSNSGTIYRNLANWAPVTMAYSNFIPSIMIYGGGLVSGAGDQVGLYNSYNAGTITVNSMADLLYIGGLVGAVGPTNANLTGSPSGSFTSASSANYYLDNNNRYYDVGSNGSDFFPGSKISTIDEMKTAGFLSQLNAGNEGDTWVSKGGSLPVFGSTQVSSIPKVKINSFKAHSENGEIVISGLQEGSLVKVYNLTGQVVWSGLAQQDLRIALSKGIYIVKTIDGQAKVIN